MSAGPRTSFWGYECRWFVRTKSYESIHRGLDSEGATPLSSRERRTTVVVGYVTTGTPPNPLVPFLELSTSKVHANVRTVKSIGVPLCFVFDLENFEVCVYGSPSRGSCEVREGVRGVRGDARSSRPTHSATFGKKGVRDSDGREGL